MSESNEAREGNADVDAGVVPVSASNEPWDQEDEGTLLPPDPEDDDEGDDEDDAA
jgi:hypothetical protein